MVVAIRLASLKGIKAHEYAVRFLFGGAVCVAAGILAKIYGPEIGGLFLAFPAIFPASARLVESHEKKHKQRAGIDGRQRARVVAGVDAAGTTLGCAGLICFALVCWFGITRWPVAFVFAAACAAWIAAGVVLWLIYKSRIFRRRGGKASGLQVFRTSPNSPRS